MKAELISSMGDDLMKKPQLTQAEELLTSSLISSDYFILLERAVLSRLSTSTHNREAHTSMASLIYKVKRERGL